MPLVSVIIPTYKHREYVLQTLESVFAQTFTDYEVIVVNDGSPDDTADVLRPLAESGRIRYIEQANAGQGVARNRGITESQGEYIALLDDDDLWPPDKLAWQVALLQSEPKAILVYGCAETFGGEPAFTYPGEDGVEGSVHREFLQWNFILSPGQTLIRSAALRQIGLFDGSIWGADDWDLYIRLAAIGSFLYRSDIALHYRRHAGNASGNTWRLYANCCRVQRKHLGAVPTVGNWRTWRHCRRFIWTSFYPVVVKAAQSAMAAGDWKKARALWLQSIRMKPQTLCDADVRKQMLRSFYPKPGAEMIEKS